MNNIVFTVSGSAAIVAIAPNSKKCDESDKNVKITKSFIFIKGTNEHLNRIDDIIEDTFNRLEQSIEKLGDKVASMMNIKNDEIMKDVVSNSEDDDVNYNSESIVGVKSKGEKMCIRDSTHTHTI